jgi:hypothetical protein
MKSSQELQRILNPARFSGMSGKMQQIVASVLEMDADDRVIDQLYITSDGHLLAQHIGDIGYNHFIGSADDLESNWSRLLDAVNDELTPQLRREANKLYQTNIQRS